MKKIGFVISFLILFSPIFGQFNVDTTDINQFIEKQREQFRVPGIAACVIHQDKIVWSNAYGWADIENKIPMSNSRIMNIGSISKTFAATAIMQLVERGEIDLEKDINEYLPIKIRNPHFENVPITTKQLLTHTSSIRDGLAYKKGYDCGDPKVSLSAWMNDYFSTEGMYFNPDDNFYKQRPDSTYHYSNVGFGVLGYLIEIITGKSLNVYCKENIFKPLQMDKSGYFLREVDTSNLIVPYLYLGPLQRNLTYSKDVPLPYYNPYCNYGFINYPDGLVRTSIDDLSKFAIAYMNDGKYNTNKILQKETVGEMLTPQLNKKMNRDQDQGLCWFNSTGLRDCWYHGGSDPGISTRMYIDQKNKLGVIVFQNANSDNTFYIIRKLYRTFKEQIE